MQCCFGSKKAARDDPPYSKVDAGETRRLINGLDVSGSKYSSAEEFLNHHKSIHDNKINLWTYPDDVTHSIEEEDRELASLIWENESCNCSQRRDKINNRVEGIREQRRETLRRWRKVLVSLGFDQEADQLLDIQTTTHSEDPAGADSGLAVKLHNRLVEESGIFGVSSSQLVRYIVVLNRLLDLDIAESFVTEAIVRYPGRTAT